MAEKEFQIGALIENRYRVLSVIGSGGMGTLYRVSDEAHQDGAQDDEIVALKTVKLRGPAAEAPERVAHFQREFQLLTQLRHPNLVSVYDFGITTEGELYFTMEWIEGEDLEPTLHPLEPEATIPVMVQVCRALAYLHARGVIHGDLKPLNVLMAGNQVKLVDFGLAREVRSPEDQARYHTPYYSAPEVTKLEPVDHRADLYSLGAMWFALLVGEPPMFMPGLGKERLIRFALDETLERQRQVPAALEAVISRLMATSPEDRYGSANEVIEAVNQVTGSAYELETRETAASYALRTHFVNREAEIETLQTAWKEAQDSTGKVVLISGESGVGKTRLVAELEVQAELGGAWGVWGQCVERGGDAYHPWREVLRVLVRYVEGADEAAGEPVMKHVGPVLAGLLPRLWERGYMADLSPPAELEPQAAQLRLNDAIVKMMRAAAGLRPTMIIIENVHWADEATLEMLRYLARVPGAADLLVCITYRDDEVRAEHMLETLTGEQVQRIRVYRLSPEVTTDLVRSMLGLEQLPALLTERVQQTTGGNAFFVQELIRSLAAEGEVLRRTVEGWQVDRKALRKAQLPESIRQVVERRLVQLSAQARLVLEWAAVVGKVFWEEVVAEAGRVTRAEVRAALGELREQELVRVRDETSFEGEREYLFLNPTVQEIGYASLPQDEQREAHGRAAAWLIARGEEKASEHLGLIADQLERAGQTEQAVAYLRQAGEQAAVQFANAEAVAYFSRALALMPEDALAERYALLLIQEKVYDVQGAREAQRQNLTTLQRLADALDGDGQQAAKRRIEVALRWANYADMVSDYPAAIRASQTAIRLAQATQDVSNEAMAYWQWGLALWFQEDFKKAQVKTEQALTLARVAGMRGVEADSLRALGVSLNHQGRYTEGMAYQEQSLHICRAIGDQRGESSTLNNLGIVSTFLGDYVGAMAYYEQSLRISREIGHRWMEGSVSDSLGLLFHHLGNHEAALEHSQRAWLISREVDNHRGRGFYLTTMGHALMGLERIEEAADAYQQAVTLRRELGQHNLAMESLAGLARVSLTRKYLAQAQTRMEEILSYLEENSLDGTEEPFRIYLTCYRVLCANQDHRARSILKTAYRLLQEQAAKITDEELRRLFLENVAAHRGIVQELEKNAPT